ncbi:hypothetical protein HZH68_015657 [Vespula germanica]|uniref:Uncharacterized protein n=1 Tax=Vespula germanica TaxID=30212 RepID=A0A834MS90_VESGE|nr:hypothetical protein HZH68_015657 [Vespula germanica]
MIRVLVFFARGYQILLRIRNLCLNVLVEENDMSVLRARDDSRKSSGLLSIPPSPEVKRCFAIAKGAGEKTKESFGRIGVKPYDKIVSLKNDRDLRESSVGIAKYSDIPYNVSERDCFGSSSGVALRRRTRIEKEDRKDRRGV